MRIVFILFGVLIFLLIGCTQEEELQTSVPPLHDQPPAIEGPDNTTLISPNVSSGEVEISIEEDMLENDLGEAINDLEILENAS